MDAPPTTTAEAPVVATDPPAPFLSAESSYDADPPPPPPPGEDDAADANAEETKSRSPEADGDGDSATPAPAVVDADDDATPMSPADPLFATGAAIQEDASDAPDVDAAAPPAATARRRPQTARPSRGGASSASASESSKPLPGKPSSASSRPKSAMRPASGLKSSRPTCVPILLAAAAAAVTAPSRDEPRRDSFVVVDSIQRFVRSIQFRSRDSDIHPPLLHTRNAQERGVNILRVGLPENLGLPPRHREDGRLREDELVVGLLPILPRALRTSHPVAMERRDALEGRSERPGRPSVSRREAKARERGR